MTRTVIEPVRIKQQFREKTCMTYELTCDGAPLVLHVFEEEENRAWRIEACAAESPTETATASSRKLAFQEVARMWKENALARGATAIDWDAVGRALSAVRALGKED